MKIKLIYKDSENSYLVRMRDGSHCITDRTEAMRISQESRIDISESKEVKGQEINLDWSNGIPILSYFQKNREKLCKYQREYRRKKKLDKSLVSG